MKLLSILAFLFITTTVLAVEPTVSVEIYAKATKKTSLKIYGFYGDKTHLIDSCNTQKKGKVQKASFTLRTIRGFYRIISGDGGYFDFIIDTKNKLVFEFNGPVSFLTFKTSNDELNNDFILMQGKNRKTNTRAKEINQQLLVLKNTDSITLVTNERKLLVDGHMNYLKELYEKNKMNLLGKTAGVLTEPVYTDSFAKIYPSSELFLADHYFDNIQFSDPAIIRSTVLPQAFNRYFERYVEYDENGFKKAIRVILTKAKANGEVYDYALNFLIHLFGTSGPQIIFDHLIETYWKGDACTEDQTPEISTILKLQPGKTIPDMEITLGRQTTTLLDYVSKQSTTLLFFWSSTCSHCTEELEILKQVKTIDPTLCILGVHIGTDSAAFEKIEKSLSFFSGTVKENKSWEGKLANAFRVNKTPTVYIIDKKGIILARNITGQELLHYFTKKED